MDDRKIIELFWERDEQGIQLASEKYGRRLRSLAYSIVRDHNCAEECENDTYVEAWNAMPPHSPWDYLYAFLARITRHISLNCCRSRKRLKRNAYICELSAEMEQCLPAPDDCSCRMDDLAFAEMINRFLASLSEEKRSIFLRRYWYLDSVSDISGRFHCSESKVKTSLFRTRNQLRDFLEKEGYQL